MFISRNELFKKIINVFTRKERFPFYLDLTLLSLDATFISLFLFVVLLYFSAPDAWMFYILRILFGLGWLCGSIYTIAKGGQYKKDGRTLLAIFVIWTLFEFFLFFQLFRIEIVGLTDAMETFLSSLRHFPVYR